MVSCWCMRMCCPVRFALPLLLLALSAEAAEAPDQTSRAERADAVEETDPAVMIEETADIIITGQRIPRPGQAPLQPQITTPGPHANLGEALTEQPGINGIVEDRSVNSPIGHGIGRAR